MGAQRALQAAGVVALATGVAAAAPPATRHEKVAIIDLGPGDEQVRRELGTRVVAAGLDPMVNDGALEALAGHAADGDAVHLAAALAEAQRAFGALDCKAAVAASTTVAGIGAARQAAGLATPELARAWTYLLLCADRANDVDGAMRAAAQLRVLGGSADVPADVWTKYPAVDAVGGAETLPLEITADVPDAMIWIDYRPAGKAPVTTALAGEHIFAAVAGTRRGFASGAVIRTQPKITIPTQDYAGSYGDVAARVASWRGQMPSAAELGWVLGRVHARVALVRRGNSVEAWGRAGLAEQPHRLGGEDATGTLAEADRVIAVIVDRVNTWNDHAPDPDRPLMVEDPKTRGGNNDKKRDTPTKWWVYGSLGVAIVGGIALIYAFDSGTDRQRVELHFP